MSDRNAIPIEEHLSDDSDEMAFLGALLADYTGTIALLGAAADPALFSSPRARMMFEAFVALAARGAPATVFTLTDEIRCRGELAAIGGPAEITRLVTEFDYTPAVVEPCLARMRHKAAMRLAGEDAAFLADAAANWGTDPVALALAMRQRASRIEEFYHGGSQSFKPKVEFKSPSQLRAFTPPEGWNLVGDYHVQRGSPFVVGGAPGVGKSRAATALAVAGATGADWFGLPVHQKFRTMILQAENGPVRLRDEYAALDLPAHDEAIRVCTPPPFGFAFNDDGFCKELLAAIADFAPDVFIVDPWNRATSDDKSKDYLETFTRLLALLPTGDKAPALGIVAHTRKPAAGERTNGRALLNVLAGGYALGSVPRSAFVIQHASDDPEETRVVVTCCKNNDGELGPRTAWVRGNGLFEPVGGFDWQEFDSPGEKRRVVTIEDLEAVFAPDEGETRFQMLTRKQAMSQLEEHTGCKRTACYAALDTGGKFKDRLKEKGGLLTLK